MLLRNALSPRQKARLVRLFWDRHAIETGSFVLTSGKKSHLYIDCRLITTHPTGLRLGARAMARVIQDRKLGGCKLLAPVLSGVPLAVAVALLTGQEVVFDRGAPKHHAKARRFEGDLRPSDEVVLIDDLITVGSTFLSTIEALRKQRAEPRAALVLVDRQEGGEEKLRSVRVPLLSLLTAKDLLAGKPTAKTPPHSPAPDGI
ncbi:MAG: orotate phosphoribosyltransferase [Acidobacteria bacterium]|nr:orotate phosphoribosyltransferase [Acidobacteriota bacterium]